MQRLVGLLLILCVAGAYAQDNVYSHFAAGKFQRLGSIPAAGFARWADNTWYTPSTSRMLGGADNGGISEIRDFSSGKVVDFEAHSNGDVILLVRDSDADRIVRYAPATDSYVQIGYEFAAGSVNDMTLFGDSVYVCGPSSLTVAGVAARVASHVISSDDQSRTAWTPLSLPTPPAGSQPDPTIIPVCRNVVNNPSETSSLIITGTAASPNFYIIATNDVFWWRVESTKNWFNTANDAAVNANLQQVIGGVTGFSIQPERTVVADGYIYMAGNFTIGAATNILIARSNDGRTWSAATQFADTTGLTMPTGAPFFVVGTEIFLTLNKVVNGANNGLTIQNAGMYKNTIGNVGAPTRLSTMNIGTQASNGNTGPFTSTSHAVVVNGKIVYTTSAKVLTFTDAGSQDDTNLMVYRKASRVLGSDFAFDIATSAWEPALGGGVDSVTKMIVTPSNNAVWFIGTFTRVWRQRAFGLAAYNQKKGWVPLGHPLRDWSNSLPVKARGADSANPTIHAMHVFPADANAQYVIAAGDFHRIDNVTMHGISWMKTDAPDTWTAMGSTGLVEADLPSQLTDTGLYFSRPGRVYAITSSGSSPSTKKDIFVGGNFLGSAAGAGESGVAGFMPLNNIAKFEFYDTKRWVALGGGVDGTVTAIDTAGKKVFVGGAFSRAGNWSVSNIAMWDDDKKVWWPMQGGVSGRVVQIVARSENDVFVLAGNVAGGVVAGGNINWWNGQKWQRFTCDSCTSTCVSKNTLAGDGCSGDAVELKTINGKLIRRTTAGALNYFDGSQWRQFSESSTGSATESFSSQVYARRQVATGVTGGRILLANANAIVAGYSDNIVEVGMDDNNVYNVQGAGFDDTIVELVGSAGSAVVPMIAMFAFVLLALLF